MYTSLSINLKGRTSSLTGPTQWICSYCKDEADNGWELMKHVAIGHKTQIYIDNPEELAGESDKAILYDELG